MFFIHCPNFFSRLGEFSDCVEDVKNCKNGNKFFRVVLILPKKNFSNISIKLDLTKSRANSDKHRNLMKIMLRVIPFRRRIKKSCFPTVKFMHILLLNNGSELNSMSELIQFPDFVLLYNKIIRVKQLFKWCEIHFMLLFSFVCNVVFWLPVFSPSSVGVVCNYNFT